jgi:hypothetical protein
VLVTAYEIVSRILNGTVQHNIISWILDDPTLPALRFYELRYYKNLRYYCFGGAFGAFQNSPQSFVSQGSTDLKNQVGGHENSHATFLCEIDDSCGFVSEEESGYPNVTVKDESQSSLPQ